MVWIERFVAAAFLLAALVHAVPALAVLSDARVAALYGVEVDGGDLSLLLRHRALLFGVLAGLLLAAALRPELRPVVGAAGLVSVLGFVVLAEATGAPGAALARVVRVDLVLGPALAVAWGLDLWLR